MPVNVRGGSLEFNAVINNAQFKQQIDAIQKSLEGLTNTAEKEARAVDSIVRSASTAIAGYMTLATATDFIGQIVKVRGEFQQLEVAFTTMLRSKGQADLLMAQVVDLAARTPFKLQDVGEGSKKLLAYGFAASSITQNLEMLGNVAAGVGAPLNDIVYLYGTLRTQGIATGKDIREFTSRGIDIAGELAKILNINKSAVADFVSAGKVGFPEIERAFSNMTEEGGMFFDLMNKQSKTLSGQVSNLQDAWSRMLNEMGKGQEGLLSTALSSATNLVNNYQKVIDVIKVLIGAYGTYQAAVIVTNALSIIEAQRLSGVTIAKSLYTVVTTAATRAAKLFNLALLANPYVALATGIGLVVSALIVFGKEAKGVSTSQDLLKEGMAEANAKVDEQKAKLQALVAQLSVANVSEKQRLEIYNKLKAINPSLVEGIDAQALSVEKITQKVKDYIKELKNKLLLEANSAALIKSVEQESSLEKQIEQQEKLVESLKKADQGRRGVYGGSTFAVSEGGTNASKAADAKIVLDELRANYKKAQEATKELSGEQLKMSEAERLAAEAAEAAAIRGTAVIDKKIATLKEDQAANADNYKKSLFYDKEIAKLQKERDAITGAKANKSPESKAVDDSKQKLKDLLQDISDARSEINNIGITSEQAEIARIEARYDGFRRRATELKKDAGFFALIDKVEVEAIGAQKRQQRVEDFKTYLSQQQQVFSEFEDAKVKIGLEKSQELYRAQTGGFESYIQFLKVQLATLSFDKSSEGFQKRIVLAKQIAETEKANSKNEISKAAENYDALIQATANYYDKKRGLDNRYATLYSALEAEKVNLDNKTYQARKDNLDNTYKAQADSLAITESDIIKRVMSDLSTATKEQLQTLFSDVDSVIKSGKLQNGAGELIDIPPDVLDRLKGARENLKGIINAATTKPKGLTELVDILASASQGFNELGRSLSELGNSSNSDFFRGLGDLVGGVSSQLGNLSGALKDIKSGTLTQADAFAAAASFMAQAVGGIIQSAAERKRVTEQFYRDTIGLQNEMNLAITQELLLRTKLNESLFLTDYVNRMKDGMLAAVEANKQYQQSFDDLGKAQVKLGQRSAIDWNRVASNTLSGAAAGAVVGSVVPVIGTAIGAAVGAVVGLVSGLFSKKNKDSWGSLLTEYPELIKVSANGQKELNVALAQSLIKNNLVNDQTKQTLENVIATKDAYKETQDEIASVIKDLAGNLGNDLRNSLVKAFEDGTDAGAAFAESVGNILENVLSNILFNEIFGKSFQELEAKMKDSFGIGGDQNFVDDITLFFSTYGKNAQVFTDTLKAAQEEAKKQGLDIFSNSNAATSPAKAGLSGAIKGITADQADLLAGQFGGLRLTAVDHLRTANVTLASIQKIESYTANLVSVRGVLERLELNGIKVK